MQQQVHEERYLVAKQHIGAVEGAAGTCQVVGIYSSTEGSNTKRWQIVINHNKKKNDTHTHLKASSYSPCDSLKKHYYWDVNVSPWALTRSSAVIRKPNTLSCICGSLRVQFVFTSQKHISLTARVRKLIRGIKHSYQLLMGRLPSLQPPSEELSAISVPSWLRWCSISAGEIKLLLSAAPHSRQAAASAEAVSMPLYYVCSKTSLRED